MNDTNNTEQNHGDHAMPQANEAEADSNSEQVHKNQERREHDRNL